MGHSYGNYIHSTPAVKKASNRKLVLALSLFFTVALILFLSACGDQHIDFVPHVAGDHPLVGMAHAGLIILV